MKKTNNKGFSLVELIIVIAIMAVLIGVLAPQFIKYVEKSKESKDITNLDTCVEAVKIYYADKDTVPATVTVSAKKGDKFTSDDSNVALGDAGATESVVAGQWTGDLKATITFSTGAVEYDGTATYFKVNAAKTGFEAITSGASSTSP